MLLCNTEPVVGYMLSPAPSRQRLSVLGLSVCVMITYWKFVKRYLTNCLSEFHHMYNLGEVGDKDDLITFWGQRSKSRWEQIWYNIACSEMHLSSEGIRVDQFAVENHRVQYSRGVRRRELIHVASLKFRWGGGKVKSMLTDAGSDEPLCPCHSWNTTTTFQ